MHHIVANTKSNVIASHPICFYRGASRDQLQDQNHIRANPNQNTPPGRSQPPNSKQAIIVAKDSSSASVDAWAWLSTIAPSPPYGTFNHVIITGTRGPAKRLARKSHTHMPQNRSPVCFCRCNQPTTKEDTTCAHYTQLRHQIVAATATTVKCAVEA